VTITFMTKTETKAKAKVLPGSKIAKMSVAQLVEQAATLKTIVDAGTAAKKKYDALIAKLAEQLPANLGEDAEHTFDGETHKIVFGAKSKTREIVDLGGVRALLGDELFMQLAKINLTDLDKYLAEAEQADLVKESRGNRRAAVKEI
jgi:hypothetical protein